MSMQRCSECKCFYDKEGLCGCYQKHNESKAAEWRELFFKIVVASKQFGIDSVDSAISVAVSLTDAALKAADERKE